MSVCDPEYCGNPFASNLFSLSHSKTHLNRNARCSIDGTSESLHRCSRAADQNLMLWMSGVRSTPKGSSSGQSMRRQVHPHMPELPSLLGSIAHGLLAQGSGARHLMMIAMVTEAGAVGSSAVVYTDPRSSEASRSRRHRLIAKLAKRTSCRRGQNLLA